jgi:hypothetical protein
MTKSDAPSTQVLAARQAEKILAPRKAEPAPPASPAESVFRRLVLYIREFEAQLDQDQEIGGRMVSFGTTVQFHIVDMGFWGPDILTFDGVDDRGSRMKLIQNISQLNVLLVAMPKRQPEEAPQRIGFLLGKGEDEVVPAPAPAKP